MRQTHYHGFVSLRRQNGSHFVWLLFSQLAAGLPTEVIIRCF